MHYFLKQAIKTIVARCEQTDISRTADETVQADLTARAGRRLLLHDTSNELAERWIDAHGGAHGGRA